MIKTQEGDLLEAFDNGDIDILISVCNSKKTMGAGIALAIKQAFPEAHEADFAVEGEPELGTFSVARVGKGNIINLYAQKGIGNDGTVKGRNARYDALVDGLSDIRDGVLNKIGSSDKKVKIGVPHGMASDLAGGQFKIVTAILESIFEEDKNIEVIIYRIV